MVHLVIATHGRREDGAAVEAQRGEAAQCPKAADVRSSAHRGTMAQYGSGGVTVKRCSET